MEHWRVTKFAVACEQFGKLGLRLSRLHTALPCKIDGSRVAEINQSNLTFPLWNMHLHLLLHIAAKGQWRGPGPDFVQSTIDLDSTVVLDLGKFECLLDRRKQARFKTGKARPDDFLWLRKLQKRRIPQSRGSCLLHIRFLLSATKPGGACEVTWITTFPIAAMLIYKFWNDLSLHCRSYSNTRV
jgi:hypothetical protein